MKARKAFLIICIAIVCAAPGCGSYFDPSHEKSDDKGQELAQQVFMLQSIGILWTNYCPAGMPSLSAGANVLTTASNQDYYFVFPADLNYRTYRLTVDEAPGQNVYIAYATCDKFSMYSEDTTGTGITETLDVVTSPRGFRVTVSCFPTNCGVSYTLNIPTAPLF